MASLHLFNPENDFALALGRRSFTPDKGALAIRRDGRLLPLWWAEDGDAILVDSADAEAEAISLKEKFGLKGDVVTSAPDGYLPEPWGWSHYTRRLFHAAGVDDALLPEEDYLDSLRELSHRRTAITVNRLLSTPGHLMPHEARTPHDAFQIIDGMHGGNAVVKLPWSSSGRGVLYAADIPRTTLETYITGMIRRQGSVTVEPRYSRLRDFAMLFYCDGASVSYRGLSTFATDNHGFYAGNIVAPQSEIAAIIGLDTAPLITPLCRALSRVALRAGYRGWIGVDMLVYRAADCSEQIAPCIEINFRRTMGVAALYAATRISRRALITHSALTECEKFCDT